MGTGDNSKYKEMMDKWSKEVDKTMKDPKTGDLDRFTEIIATEVDWMAKRICLTYQNAPEELKEGFNGSYYNGVTNLYRMIIQRMIVSYLDRLFEDFQNESSTNGIRNDICKLILGESKQEEVTEE